MRVGWKATALAAPLFLTVACDQSNEASENMEMKRAYSLCPRSENSRQRLYDQVKSFAEQYEARLIDRSAGAQQELAAMGSDVLEKTGGNLILLTVEKSGEFRVTVGNAGLREKFGLTVRSWGEARDAAPICGFMADLGRFWVIEEVERSVENDPPC